MRLYETQCPVCTQHSVLHGVCRACGHIESTPQHPLRDDDASPSNTDETATCEELDRGDAADDISDFDLGAGG